MNPRLRFDRVAKRLIADVQTELRDDVPKGTTVIFACTAPIRLASKTAAALEAAIRTLLTSRAKQPELAKTINGNRIRIRIVRAAHQPNVVGFVHNPDPGAATALLDSALP